MRKAILVGLCALVAGACGQVPHQGPQAGDQVLYIATTNGVAAVDARTHASLALLPPGVPSPDWKHYYLASDSLLLDLNPTTGATQRSMPVPAGYTLPLVTAGRAPGGLSQDGGWLVLEKHDAAASHLLDVRTTFAQTPGRIDLAGDFTFDAVSNDGTRIYLIQHAADGHYFVRDYVVGSGLDPNVIFDKTDGSAAMSGLRLMGVPAPDGSWLYSVYARKDQSAFVHELNLEGTIALCVDLVGPGYAADGGAMQWALAMTPGGGRLVAVNGPLGVITVMIPPGGPDSGATGRVGGLSGSTSAALTPDGATLIVGARGGLRWISVNSLKTTATGLESWTVAGLLLAGDGKTIYAVSDSGRVARLDAAGHVISTFDSGLGYAGGLRGSAIFS